MDIWDRRAGRKHRTARGFGYEFAPDSRSLAMIGPDKETLTIIDAESGDELWKAALGPALQVAGLSFSPDGKTIIVGWGNVLRFFEAGSGRERFVSPEAHQGSVSVVRYAPDGDTLFTAGDDGTIRQWDAVSARQVRVIPGTGMVNLLAVSPDGKSLAAAALRARSRPSASGTWSAAGDGKIGGGRSTSPGQRRWRFRPTATCSCSTDLNTVSRQATSRQAVSRRSCNPGSSFPKSKDPII